MRVQASGYSVSLFTDWQNSNINEVWVKHKIADENATNTASEFFEAPGAAEKTCHPCVDRLSAENCTERIGVEGIVLNGCHILEMGFTPSNGKNLQAESPIPGNMR